MTTKRTKRGVKDYDRATYALCDRFHWLNKLYWFVGVRWERLHFIDGNVWDEVVGETGTHNWTPRRAACGQVIKPVAPGIFSRMGLARCSRCCRALAIPRGDGSGINDAKLVAHARRLAKKMGQPST